MEIQLKGNVEFRTQKIYDWLITNCSKNLATEVLKNILKIIPPLDIPPFIHSFKGSEMYGSCHLKIFVRKGFIVYSMSFLGRDFVWVVFDTNVDELNWWKKNIIILFFHFHAVFHIYQRREPNAMNPNIIQMLCSSFSAKISRLCPT